jgi:hypothetical protein
MQSAKCCRSPILRCVPRIKGVVRHCASPGPGALRRVLLPGARRAGTPRVLSVPQRFRLAPYEVCTRNGVEMPSRRDVGKKPTRGAESPTV